MITISKAQDVTRAPEGKLWPADGAQAGDQDVGRIRRLSLAPGADMPRHADGHAEFITYVRDGALAYEDSFGRRGIVQTGEFSRVTGGRGSVCSEGNASRTEWTHVFQISLGRAGADVEPGREQKRFSTAQRRGRLCIVASPDSRAGSLRLHQDALLLSGILGRGQHVIHALPPPNRAWLYVVHGEIAVGDQVLTAGDALAATAERALSFTARAQSEVLLVHIGPEPAVD